MGGERPVLVKLCGTSGSGKSTAMTRLMDTVGDWKGVYVEGRRKPLYYVSEDVPGVTVLGHYETDCGGCDLVGSAPEVYEAVLKVHTAVGFRMMLTEGLLWGADVKWSAKLAEFMDVRILFLTTEQDECLRRVLTRQAGREAINNARVKEKLEKRKIEIDRTRVRAIEAGLNCRRCSSDQAPRIMMDWIHKLKRGE